jgi:hypothetical protein
MIRIVAAALPAALALGAAVPLPAAAQSAPLALHTAAEGSLGGGEERIVSSALERGRYAVVIDLDRNELSFRQGDVTLWTAPVGTGTGLRLETEENEWDFSTPNGVFHVKYKEEDPIWIAPDWYFIENDLPVPPANDKKRLFPGGLGEAAVYIDHDLAIHGTDKPELLGQRVSHGCIRLSNKDATRLFHNVQVGTEVVIVGGKRARHAREEEAKAAPKGKDAAKLFNPAAPKPQPKDPLLEDWKTTATPELLVALEDELWMDPKTSRWPEVVRLLLKRALDEGDDLALRGLLMAASDLPTVAVEREYRTFLADAFARGTRRTLEALSELDPRYRNRAADAIVAASVGLYPGELDARAVPWPTGRIPESMVGPEGRRGWMALSRAEKRLREGGGRITL